MNPSILSQTTQVTTTSIQIGSNAPSMAGFVNVDIQYGTRPDFIYSIAPIITVPKAATYTFSNLNRAQTYFFRERGVDSGELRGPWSNTLQMSTLPGVDSVPGFSSVLIQPAIVVVPIKTNGFVTGSLTGYPNEAMLDGSPSTGWRATLVANSFTMQFYAGGALMDTVALLDTNLPEAATWRIKLISLDGTTVLADSGTIAFRASPNLPGRRGYHGFYRFGQAYSVGRVDITLTATLPANIVHVTHLVAGLARVTRNYSEINLQPFDLGQLQRQRDGSPVGVPGFRGRRVDFTISALTETQHETAYADLADRVGLDQPVFIVPNSKSGLYLHDRLLYGPLLSTRAAGARLRYDRQFSVESIINP